MPTAGEPNFDRTDLNESDQIGLTGFKMNRISAGPGQPESGRRRHRLLHRSRNNWPQRLYEQFTDPNPDGALRPAAGGELQHRLPVRLGPVPAGGRADRALQPGPGLRRDLDELRAHRADRAADLQRELPVRRAAAAADGDGRGRRRLRAPLVGRRRRARRRPGDRARTTSRATASIAPPTPSSATRRSSSPAPASGPIGNGKPIAQFDLVDGKERLLGADGRGRRLLPGQGQRDPHTWTDYDRRPTGSSTTTPCARTTSAPTRSSSIPPRTRSPSRARRAAGWSCRPTSSAVRPEPPVAGFRRRANGQRDASVGRGSRHGRACEVVNSNLVPDDHVFKLELREPSPDSIRATTYALTDSTTGDRVVQDRPRLRRRRASARSAAACCRSSRRAKTLSIDKDLRGFEPGSPTNAHLKVAYQNALPINLRRLGFPRRLSDRLLGRRRGHRSSSSVRSTRGRPSSRSSPTRETGDRQLDFRFRDLDADGTLSRPDECFDIVTYLPGEPAGPEVDLARAARHPRHGRRCPASAGAGDVYRLETDAPLRRRRCFRLPDAGAAHRRRAGAIRDAAQAVRRAQSVRGLGELRAGALRGLRARRAAHRVPRPAAAVARSGSTPCTAISSQTLQHDGSQRRLRGVEPAHEGQPRCRAGPLRLPRRRRRSTASSIGKFAIIK